MFILDVFFLDSCDQEMEDMADAAMKEDFKLVSKSSMDQVSHPHRSMFMRGGGGLLEE